MKRLFVVLILVVMGLSETVSVFSSTVRYQESQDER
jgi:hypothetical protein